MAEIGRWNGHKFTVSTQRIESFSGLSIKGSAETKNKTRSKQQYVTRKAGKPKEISLTVHLHASLGINVRHEAETFVSEAIAGKKDYFYIGSKKLSSYKIMLTEASISQIEISPSGKWISADVALTLKQAGAKKKKKSKKRRTTSTGSTGAGAVAGAVLGALAAAGTGTTLGAPIGGAPKRAGGGAGKMTCMTR